MGKGIIRIDEPALRKHLLLPENYIIRAMQTEWTNTGGCELSLWVESEEIPEITEGQPLPIVEPVYHDDGAGRMTLQDMNIRENSAKPYKSGVTMDTLEK